MFLSVMKYLYFVSSFILLMACASSYKDLKRVQLDEACLEGLLPAFQKEWYSVKINVMGKHMSGLVLVKSFPDNTRIVFTNEPGVKFFDFEFGDSSFVVHYIINQLNKKPVIETLKSDLELMFIPAMGHYDTYHSWRENYFRAESGDDFEYYVTDENCSTLLRSEIASARKRKVEVKYFGWRENIPDSMFLQHHNFNMDMSFKRIDR